MRTAKPAALELARTSSPEDNNTLTKIEYMSITISVAGIPEVAISVSEMNADGVQPSAPRLPGPNAPAFDQRCPGRDE